MICTVLVFKNQEEGENQQGQSNVGAYHTDYENKKKEMEKPKGFKNPGFVQQALLFLFPHFY